MFLLKAQKYLQETEGDKMARKPALGRGLDALIPGGDFSTNDQSGDAEASLDPGADIGVETDIEQPAVSLSGARDSVVQIAVDRLAPNPGQPRKNFDETELGELADSIKEHGIIMPIIVADTGGENYTIIAGERRTRAAKLAGLAEVPVIIRNYTDQKRMEISLIENIQRSDLNPIEEATAYKNLMDFSSLSHEELAARVGKNRSTVTNALRLLKLSAEMQKGLETGELSAGHARALLSVTDKKLREKLFNEITAKGLSVREAEKKASALNSGNAGNVKDTDSADGVAKEKASKRPPEITEMEEKFIEKLGTKVSIAGGLEKGLIRIEYYSMEDLDRLYGILYGK
jgi:ParB family transcriptional regulator, chromosome partitioning protein